MATSDDESSRPGVSPGLRGGFLKTTTGKALGAVVLATIGVVLTIVLPPLIERLNDPVRVVVETNLDKIDVEGSPAEGSYVIQKPIEEVGDPPNGADDCLGRYAWAHALGGVDADRTGVRVVVEGRWSSPVIINGFHPRVVRPGAPLIGSHVTCPPKGGEVADVRFLAVELRKAGATYRYHPPKNDTHKSFAFTVSKGQTELFHINAQAIDCDCEWVADLELIVDGKKETVTITDDDDKPFRTTAFVNAKRYHWVNGKWVDASALLGGSNTPSSGIQVPRLTACNLVTKADVERLLAQSVIGPSEVGFDEHASKSGRRVLRSGCKYEFRRPSDQRLVWMVVVQYEASRNAADGNAEFDEATRTLKLNTSVRSTPLPGIGDEALGANHAVFARKGAQTITVWMFPRPPASADRPTLRLARLAVKRAWG